MLLLYSNASVTCQNIGHKMDYVYYTYGAVYDIAKSIHNLYAKMNYEWADPRTNNLLLMSSPFLLLTILGLYLYACVVGGPNYMKHREPFKLKYTIIIYNIFQIVSSIYFFVELLPFWLFKYSLKCEPVDYSYNPDAVHMANVAHFYFLSKIIELLDTIFFVLRKKYSQVSILHLYHHTIMVAAEWYAVKYVAGGQTTLVCVVNSFVHMVMYFYYLIASLGPKYQKYLRWKKQLTLLQLAQFLFGIGFTVQNIPRKCSYPRPLVWLQFCQAVIFFCMFANFYYQAYIKPGKTNVHKELVTQSTEMNGKKES